MCHPSDYVCAGLSVEEAQVNHQKVVDAFTKCRRSLVYGWNPLDDDELGMYVVHEIDHHVQHAFQQGSWQSNPVFISWVDSIPPDAIAHAAWSCLSMSDFDALADESLAREDWVTTAVRYNAKASRLARSKEGHQGDQVRDLRDLYCREPLALYKLKC